MENSIISLIALVHHIDISGQVTLDHCAHAARILQSEHDLGQEHGVMRLHFLEFLAQCLIFIDFANEQHCDVVQLQPVSRIERTYLVIETGFLLLQLLILDLKLRRLLLPLQSALGRRQSVGNEPIKVRNFA